MKKPHTCLYNHEDVKNLLFNQQLKAIPSSNTDVRRHYDDVLARFGDSREYLLRKTPYSKIRRSLFRIKKDLPAAGPPPTPPAPSQQQPPPPAPSQQPPPTAPPEQQQPPTESDKGKDLCPKCQVEYPETKIILPCGHGLCETCYRRTVGNKTLKCAYCRSKFTESKTTRHFRHKHIVFFFCLILSSPLPRFCVPYDILERHDLGSKTISQVVPQKFLSHRRILSLCHNILDNLKFVFPIISWEGMTWDLKGYPRLCLKNFLPHCRILCHCVITSLITETIN